MENTNKIISFVLGLVVVIVFLAIITGRLRLGSINFLPLSRGSTTPTITPKPTVSPRITIINPTSFETADSDNHSYQTTNGGSTTLIQPSPTKSTNYNTQTKGGINNVQSIPSTGAPTVLLPILTGSFFAGLWLKKHGNTRTK